MGDPRDAQRTVAAVPRADPWPEGRALGAAVTYPTGSVLLRQGEPVDSVFLIEKGVIKLIRTEANGRELIAAFRSPGWLLGATGVILSGPAELTAQCACECRLRPAGVDAFRRIHTSDPAVSAWVQRMLAREVREHSTRVGQFLLKPAERLARLLAALTPQEHAGLGSGARRMQFPIRQHEVADAIGVRRETATRLLIEAERKGLIERKGGWIMLTA